MVFTDGSQKKGDHLPGGIAVGAAWAVIHGGKSRTGRFGCGQATPYDAEMAASARGLKEVVRDIPDSVSDIHVFADNRAALTSILAAGRGPLQMLAISACASVWPWLEASPEHCIHIRWCPGHRGVYWNTVVDRDTGRGATEPCSDISFAYARQRITANAYTAWQEDMHLPAYRGRHNLVQPADFNHYKHTSANWFLKTAGCDSTYLARLVRFTSGHFPHGAFRERFNFEGNRGCWCGKADPEDRDHIWFDCDLWIKKHKPPDDVLERYRWGDRGVPRALDLLPPTPPGVTLLEHFLRDWRATLIQLDDVAEFLQLNPVVGTFTWLELIDCALQDRADGESESLALLKVKLHTTIRKAAYERWRGNHPKEPLSQFTELYAASAAATVCGEYEIDERSQVALLVEFGMPPAKARETRRGVAADDRV